MFLNLLNDLEVAVRGEGGGLQELSVSVHHHPQHLLPLFTNIWEYQAETNNVQAELQECKGLEDQNTSEIEF